MVAVAVGALKDWMWTLEKSARLYHAEELVLGVNSFMIRLLQADIATANHGASGPPTNAILPLGRSGLLALVADRKSKS